MTRAHRHRGRALGLVLGGAVIFGCSGARTGALESRYVAVHNTLAALGMVQIGPIHRGSLVDGAEVKLPLDLPAGCTVVVGLGSAGVDDLDLALLDADGRAVQSDGSRDAEPSIRVCLERPAKRVVAVRMTRGAGDFVAATWSGAAPATGATAQADAAEAREPAGTCASPAPLSTGTVSGNTRRGDSEHAAACASSPSREIVYKLVLEKQQRVILSVDAPFDTVLYVREGECEDPAAEVACNDDRPGSGTSSHTSRIDEVFEPGTYYVFVDGYGSEMGAFRLDVQIGEVASLADACREARPLVGKVQSTWEGVGDHTGAGTCAAARGPDRAWKLDVPVRSRVRLGLQTNASGPIVHVRKTCTDEASEIGCGDRGPLSGGAVWAGILDPASYTVFADTEDRGATAPFTLAAEILPERGTGTRGDACSDAIAIGGADARIDGDTFAAHDDLASKSGVTGAPDVVYRLEVTRTSRVRASFGAQEADHVLAVRTSCVDATSEIMSGPLVDRVLAPGTYFLVVEPKEAGTFGRYRLDVRMRDQTAPDAACRSAPLLVPGRVVQGTTAGAGDKFGASCAGAEDKRASPDRIYRLVVAKRARMRVTLTTPTWDGVLALRRTCLDAPELSSLRANEVACNNDHHDTHHAQIETVLDPGTYHVLVDGHGAGNEGPFTLEAQVLGDAPAKTR